MSQNRPPLSGDTRLSLLDALRAGDAVAWSQFVPLYAPLIYCWCRRAGLSAEDSADLLQQVLVKVWAGIAAFESRAGSSFRGWLAIITRRALLDFFRAQRGAPSAAGGTEALRTFHQLPADIERSTEFLNADLRGLAQRAMRMLHTSIPPESQKLFELTILNNHSTAEAAALLGSTPVAVRKAKSRLLKKLREILEDA